MYNELKDKSIFQQVEKLTTTLVNTLSLNGSHGETEIAKKITSILKDYPYFKQHPEYVWIQSIANDPLGRKNVFARIKGKGRSKKTIIFHSHLDTVGIHDYGNLQDIANQPEKLLAFFKQWDHNKEIKRQALSGEWLFGRGALDMKSGIAVHMANLLFFSEHREEWDGEIIFMANPDEENQHQGILAALDELSHLREEEQLDYLVAVNNDFFYPLFLGDDTNYIYTGATGKLLPNFYVYGRETHVGQPLDGLDPTVVTSELNRLISNNMDLTEDIEGEMMVPPSTLLQKDTKEFYNVQTAVTSFLYFNYMVYEASPKDILHKLKEIAKIAAKNVKVYYQEQYNRFIKLNHIPVQAMSWDLNVYTYQEFCLRLAGQGIDVEKVVKNIVQEHQVMEPRLLGFKIVDTLRKLDESGNPCIILFYAPPYLPHHYLNESEDHKGVLSVIKEVTEQWEKENNDHFSIKRFFPFLSDSSYLSIHDTDEELQMLTANFPVWNQVYKIPIQRIREFNIPAINVGVLGFDAHRWTERVYKPYSFETLPLIIRNMVKRWLQNDEVAM